MKVLDEYGLDYVVEKIYDAVNSGGSADYIVEQGTSANGIWTYRKWASGIAECWGMQFVTITSQNNWNNQKVARPWFDAVDYPFTFYSRPTEVVNIAFATSNSAWLTIEGGYSNSTTKTAVYSALKNNDFTNGSVLAISYDVKGLWKAFTPSVSRQGTSVKAWNFTAASGTTIHNNNVVVANGVVMGGLKFKFNASGSGWRDLGTTTDKPNSTEAFPLINLSSGTWLGELQVRADGTIAAYYVSAYANDAYVNLIYDIAD